MTINSVSSIYSAPKTLSTALTNQTHASSNVSSSIATVSGNSKDSVASNSLDFTSMSPREFNNLYKSGGFGSDLPPIALPAAGLDATKDTKQQMYAAQDQKINYIDMIQKQIEFNKSIGAPIEQDSNILSKMMTLQGKSVQQPTINSYV